MAKRRHDSVLTYSRPMRVDELTCERTRPQFYRVRDAMEPRAKNERQVWITRSRGRATCPEDGSPVVTVTRDSKRTNLCLSCLSQEA